MILLAVLPVLCWVLSGAGAQVAKEKCDAQCSEGLQCKTKPGYMFSPPCQNPPEDLFSSFLFQNISLSTAMRCTGRQQCSLHLQINTQLQLTEPIHGMSISATGAGIVRSQILSFTRASREKMFGRQIEVEINCFDVSPGEDVQVTVKTLPNYCGLKWSSTYQVPGCRSGDLRKHVPECITGRLSYTVNQQKRELSVNVSDMLEDKDYHLRLCHKDFICMGTGAQQLIKKTEPVKSATLHYGRAVPCLCIEGFSAVTDAPRVQVCPFKDRIEELWFGLTFDPEEETLSWEPACRIEVTIALCQMRQDGVCVELPHSTKNVSREKIAYSTVDPHPQLCVKFTVGVQSWIKCPFTDGRFQAWEVKHTDDKEVQMRSQITADFSVGRLKSGLSNIATSDEEHTVHLSKLESIRLNMTGDLCESQSCVQVKRTDVKYAVTVLYCFQQCDPVSTPWAKWEVNHVIIPTVVCLCTIIVVALLLHLLLTVYQRMKKSQQIPVKGTDSVPSCMRTALHVGIFTSDPQFRNCEKTNLIC